MGGGVKLVIRKIVPSPHSKALSVGQPKVEAIVLERDI
jgi:hypothetical protein